MKKNIWAGLLFVAVMLFVSIGQAAIFLLPDTGQTKCYQSVYPYAEISCAGTGQDGEYSINPMSYTDNGDGTITDNNTKFMWQKEDDGNTYYWYQAAGIYDATYNSNSQNVCGALNLGGYSDWRLPSKKELATIVDYSISYPGPTINATYFPNTKSSGYFTSTSYVSYPYYYAWAAYFNSGDIWLSDKDFKNYYVRCVRGEQYSGPNLSDNGNGTITDNKTGRMWQQGEQEKMTWDSALSYCEGLNLGGHSDWRLPNIRELESLTDDTRYNPTIDTNFFPNAYASHYWSSTTFARHLDVAWSLLFYDCTGTISFKDGSYWSTYVRCVRGGNVANPLHSLTVSLGPQEGGNVTSVPAGLICSGNTCTGSFPQGTEVTLTASPNAGWLFVNWDDGITCSPENPRTIVMDRDKTISAVFASAEKRAGAVIFIDGIQILQILFDPLSVWPWPDYSQYLVDYLDDSADAMFQKKSEAVVPFLWAGTTNDTDAISRLSQLLEHWTAAVNKTGGRLTVVSHSWGTVLSYIAISSNKNIHVDKLVTLGSPLGAGSLVKWYLNKWLDPFELASLPRPFNVDIWHNYWAKCDPISASIRIADKKGNFEIATNVMDCGFFSDFVCLLNTPLNHTCHSAYFRDGAIWSDILRDVTKKK